MGKVNKPGIPHELDESNGKLSFLLENGVESYMIPKLDLTVSEIDSDGAAAGTILAADGAGGTSFVNIDQTNSGSAPAGTSLFANGNGALNFNVPALKVITFPFSHSDGAILVGETVHQLAVGECLLPQSGISIETAFNGTTPFLDLLYGGKLVHADATVVDAPISIFSGDPTLFNSFASIADKFLGALSATDGATPIKIQLSDGVGGDPGSTQGAGTVILYIVSAVQI
jgi:hypothetical protein